MTHYCKSCGKRLSWHGKNEYHCHPCKKAYLFDFNKGQLIEKKIIEEKKVIKMTEYKKGTPWLVLTPEMKQFEKKTGKSAVFRGKITGQFEYWLWMEDKRSKGLTRKKRSSVKSKSIKEERKKYLDTLYESIIMEMIDFISTEKATPQDLAELYDNLSIYDIHYLLKKYYEMPYWDWKKRNKKLYGK